MKYTVTIQLGSKIYPLLQNETVDRLRQFSFFLDKEDLTDGALSFKEENSVRKASIKIKLPEAVRLPFGQSLVIGDLVKAHNYEGQILNKQPFAITAISPDKKYIQIAELGQSFLSVDHVSLANYYQYNAQKMITRIWIILKMTDGKSLYFEAKDAKEQKLCSGLF